MPPEDDQSHAPAPASRQARLSPEEMAALLAAMKLNRAKATAAFDVEAAARTIVGNPERTQDAKLAPDVNSEPPAPDSTNTRQRAARKRAPRKPQETLTTPPTDPAASDTSPADKETPTGDNPRRGHRPSKPREGSGNDAVPQDRTDGRSGQEEIDFSAIDRAKEREKFQAWSFYQKVEGLHAGIKTWQKIKKQIMALPGGGSLLHDYLEALPETQAIAGVGKTDEIWKKAAADKETYRTTHEADEAVTTKLEEDYLRYLDLCILGQQILRELHERAAQPTEGEPLSATALEARLAQQWRKWKGQPSEKLRAVEDVYQRWIDLDQQIRQFHDEERLIRDIRSSGLEADKVKKILGLAADQENKIAQLEAIKKTIEAGNDLSDQEAGFLTAHFHGYRQLIAVAERIVKEREVENAVVSPRKSASPANRKPQGGGAEVRPVGANEVTPGSLQEAMESVSREAQDAYAELVNLLESHPAIDIQAWFDGPDGREELPIREAAQKYFDQVTILSQDHQAGRINLKEVTESLKGYRRKFASLQRLFFKSLKPSEVTNSDVNVPASGRKKGFNTTPEQKKILKIERQLSELKKNQVLICEDNLGTKYVIQDGRKKEIEPELDYDLRPMSTGDIKLFDLTMPDSTHQIYNIHDLTKLIQQNDWKIRKSGGEVKVTTSVTSKSLDGESGDIVSSQEEKTTKVWTELSSSEKMRRIQQLIAWKQRFFTQMEIQLQGTIVDEARRQGAIQAQYLKQVERVIDEKLGVVVDAKAKATILDSLEKL